MTKMKSWDELKKIREKAKSETGLRMTSENKTRTVLAVGMATCGIAAGAREIMTALQNEIKARGLDNISIISTGCFGFCYAEPMVEVRSPDKPPVRYGRVNEELAREIINKHIINGELLQDSIISMEVGRT